MLPAMTARGEPVSVPAVVPGDGLLQSLPLLAIGLLVLNDHVLKAAWPGVATGKLSDFCGLLFFPLFLQAAWEVGSAAFGRPSIASQRVLGVAIALSAVVFTAIQLVPIASDLYRHGLGLLQWLAGLLPAALTGAPIGSPRAVQLTPDPTDLVALPALAVAWWLGRRRSSRVEP